MSTDLTIEIRCDEDRTGDARTEQLAAIKAARRAARTLNLTHTADKGPHDVDAVQVGVNASDLDVFLVGLRDSGGDWKNITAVHVDDDVKPPLGVQMKIHTLFGDRVD